MRSDIRRPGFHLDRAFLARSGVRRREPVEGRLPPGEVPGREGCRPLPLRGGADGVNSAVTADPSWTPLLNTPNFPEYVSGHSAFSMAAATVLDSEATLVTRNTRDFERVPGLKFTDWSK